MPSRALLAPVARPESAPTRRVPISGLGLHRTPSRGGRDASPVLPKAARRPILAAICETQAGFTAEWITDPFLAPWGLEPAIPG
jgi:hypothetical protein